MFEKVELYKIDQMGESNTLVSDISYGQLKLHFVISGRFILIIWPTRMSPYSFYGAKYVT